MDDLVQWIGCQLEDDERIAKAAAPGPWHVRDDGVVADDGEHWPVAYTDSRLGGEDCAHIAEHDPARVLREIDAKRQVLADWEQAERYSRTTWGQSNADQSRARTLGKVVRLLAVPYADRPGYKEDWRP